jgi:hypothetical protein
MNNESRVFLLMNNATTEMVYLNESIAQYDCWLCNEASKYEADPMPYWIKAVPFVTEDILLGDEIEGFAGYSSAIT